ncbi:CRZ2 [Candida oxycetoniae]|uniref:pH-response transcription factor pacC/RIM101 n=1 Tax=Candida oxycetoniae TaxID=497107 RepID=A0AAI9WZH2_9ASCO|nr:CRZ2 [Candida oxycetoniae]KAI3406054.2 CRZ2 [Candida oxycetoniae]
MLAMSRLDQSAGPSSSTIVASQVVPNSMQPYVYGSTTTFPTNLNYYTIPENKPSILSRTSATPQQYSMYHLHGQSYTTAAPFQQQLPYTGTGTAASATAASVQQQQQQAFSQQQQQQNLQPLPFLFVAQGHNKVYQSQDGSSSFPVYYESSSMNPVYTQQHNSNQLENSSLSSTYSYSPQQHTSYVTPQISNSQVQATNSQVQATNSPQRSPISMASTKSGSISSTSSAASLSTYSQPSHYHNGNSSATNSNSSFSNPSNIDYSSIVSYTISSSLIRKRRQRKTNLVNPSSIGPDSVNSLGLSEVYPCTQCDKVFQKPYNLKSHMKTHSTDKPFRCSYCPKTFARSHDKKRHEVLHQGVKNFKCEGYLQDGITRWGCGKKFARSDALSRHFRTETGWLCIRPLMDEAKKLEEQGIPSNLTSNENNASRPPQLTACSAEYKYNGDDEIYDNSSLIRKLIHNKQYDKQ